MLCCTTAWFKQLFGFALWPFSGSIYYIYCSLAYVASVSNRLIARKLERAKKKEGGGGEKRKCLPANPTILENAPWYVMVRFICKLTARQNRTDYPWITRFVKLLCSLIEHIPGDCKNWKTRFAIKASYNSEPLLWNFLFFIVWLYLVWNLVEMSKMICPEQFTLPAVSFAEWLLFSLCRNVLYNRCR